MTLTPETDAMLQLEQWKRLRRTDFGLGWRYITFRITCVHIYFFFFWDTNVSYDLDLPQSRSRMETWRLDVSAMSSPPLLVCSDLRSQGHPSILSSTLGFVGRLTWLYRPAVTRGRTCGLSPRLVFCA